MSNPPTRTRILIVTRNLPPLVGGMERLNWHMAAELAKVAEVRVVGPQGSAALAPANVIVREAPLKPLWKFLVRARALARREARAWKPHIVLAGSGLTAPLARAAARVCRAKTAVYIHGLDVAVRHPVYRAIWLPAIRHCDRIIANSQATSKLCREIGVDPARIGIVHPGVDLPEEAIPLNPPSQANGEEKRTPFGTKGVDAKHRGDVRPVTQPAPVSGSTPPALHSPRPVIPGLREAQNPESSPSDAGEAANAVQDFRTRHGLANRRLLLSVGRLSERKGLREFVTLALPKIVAGYPDVMLLVVGDSPSDALHAQAQTPDSIRAAAQAAGVADNLRFLGTITDYAELGSVYRAADVHVFPVRQIPADPEGFGMVAVEAAAHGLPTVAFATGGIVDAVSENESGHLVPPGDYPAFAKAVEQVLSRARGMAEGSVMFSRQFAWPLFGRQVVAQLASFSPHVAGASPPS